MSDRNVTDVPRERPIESRLCVLVVASPARRERGRCAGRSRRRSRRWEPILDEAVLKVNGEGKTRVYDPRRTWQATLTPPDLGFVRRSAGGWKGCDLGARRRLCGGERVLTEHIATKSELKRIGGRCGPIRRRSCSLPRGRCRRLLSTVALEQAGRQRRRDRPDLSAEVFADDASTVDHEHRGAAQKRTRALAEHAAAALPGEQAAKAAAETTKSNGRIRAHPGGADRRDGQERKAPGRRPDGGSAAWSKEEIVGWGVCGVAGARSPASSATGALSDRSKSAAGRVPGRSSACRGALYGLGQVGLCRQDDSRGSGWTLARVLGRRSGDVGCKRWPASGTDRLILRFGPIGHGVRLEV